MSSCLIEGDKINKYEHVETHAMQCNPIYMNATIWFLPTWSKVNKLFKTITNQIPLILSLYSKTDKSTRR